MSGRWEIMSYSYRILIFGHRKKRETLEKAFFSPDFFSLVVKEKSLTADQREKRREARVLDAIIVSEKDLRFSGVMQGGGGCMVFLWGKWRGRMCVFTFQENRMQGGKRLTGERGKKEGSNGEGRKEEGRPDTRNRIAKIKFNNNTLH